jgi:hypothetical protein
MSNQPQQAKAELVSESSTFIRLPNADGQGNDWLEVRVTSRLKMPNGVQHDIADSFILAGQDAIDTLASLKMIHSNIKMLLLKAQQEQESKVQATSEPDIEHEATEQ